MCCYLLYVVHHELPSSTIFMSDLYSLVTTPSHSLVTTPSHSHFDDPARLTCYHSLALVTRCQSTLCMVYNTMRNHDKRYIVVTHTDIYVQARRGFIVARCVDSMQPPSLLALGTQYCGYLTSV